MPRASAAEQDAARAARHRFVGVIDRAASAASRATIAAASRATIVAVLAAAVAGNVAAQAPSPAATPGTTPSRASAAMPSSTPGVWPTGDALRRDLQLIRFDFRVDGDSGEWLGWPPRAAEGDAPAVRLGGAGSEPATAIVELALIDGDPGAALTALLEIGSRLPVAQDDLASARRFIVDDLLEEPPETLEDCYRSGWAHGAMLVELAPDGATARLYLAPDPTDLPLPADTELDLAECEPLVPSAVVAELGDPVSERVSVTVGGEPPAFQPAVTTVEAPLLTLILSVSNDTATEQTLTFEAPLTADTGAIAPGERVLIVVREIEPGDYAFFSETDPTAIRGALVVVAPSAGSDTGSDAGQVPLW